MLCDEPSGWREPSAARQVDRGQDVGGRKPFHVPAKYRLPLGAQQEKTP
ncbi:hypothetical protein EBBID32_27650 [Sphingobium indicum BiD32]|uniref:Uncharacterized protein n=1 Tax=Sphingobium indicum BiD32 TaxID=1301087 RepID=N1MRW2_9SPHN|nr:hypothetical protein EBBID32_27650 [Sphingobium indicum BiD32]